MTVTDAHGELIRATNEKTNDDDDDEVTTAASVILSRRRVRMPSSILSELYPTLPSPYYRESYFGAVDISEEDTTRENVQYGENKFAPKYPFYRD